LQAEPDRPADVDEAVVEVDDERLADVHRSRKRAHRLGCLAAIAVEAPGFRRRVDVAEWRKGVSVAVAGELPTNWPARLKSLVVATVSTLRTRTAVITSSPAVAVGRVGGVSDAELEAMAATGMREALATAQ